MINQYIEALRKAAAYREFRELDEVLLDRLICGVRDINLQRRLLAKPNLTLQTALDKARADESSNRSTAVIQKTGSPPSSHQAVTVHCESTEGKESTNEEDKVCHLHS